MNINELHQFRLSDAVKFHDNLNSALFDDERLDPEVRDQLLLIAQDFMDHMGIEDVDIKDITLSGSNAAYTYTSHSDIDVHIIIDYSKLDNDDVYRELFNSKKVLFNDSHDIKVRGYDVEMYVQDSAEPVKSLGEYSILNDRWIKFPVRRRANLDQNATKHKFNKIVQLAELALRSSDLDAVNKLLETLRKYRQAGLDVNGEFGPENLVYKALRTHGILDQLYDHSDRLHSNQFSIDEDDDILDKPTLTVDELAKLHGVSTEHIRRQLFKGMKVELEHTSDPSIAREIASDHLRENPNYYDLLKSIELEEGASGYIPSKREANDPRFKTALTVDIKPDSIKKNAKKMGLGNIHRSGIPQTARADGKFK